MIHQRFAALELIDDLEFLTTKLGEVHPDPFFALPQVEFLQRAEAIKASLHDEMTPIEFFEQAAGLLAALNDEHTWLEIPTEEHGDSVFPVDLVFCGNEAYVAVDCALPLGSQIVRVNNVPMRDMIDRFTSCISGTRIEQRLAILTRQWCRLVYLFYCWDREFQIEYLPPGTHETQYMTVAGTPISDNPRSDYRFHVLASEKIGVIELNRFTDGKAFASFLRETFEQIHAQAIRYLIVDVRGSRGGATALGDALLSYLTDKPFRQLSRAEFKVSRVLKENLKSLLPSVVRWLPLQYLIPTARKIWTTPEGKRATISFAPITGKPNPLRFRGDVFVLIGPYTMSSASLFAATVQANRIGTLVGQSAGGSATHFGNVWRFRLPNTGLAAMIPSSVNYGNGQGKLEPDVVADQDIHQQVRGVDVELECVRRLIAVK